MGVSKGVQKILGCWDLAPLGYKAWLTIRNALLSHMFNYSKFSSSRLNRVGMGSQKLGKLGLPTP